MDSLTPEQQDALNRTKMAMRINNEKYIREHTELKHLISIFMAKLLKDKVRALLWHKGGLWRKRFGSRR